MLAIDGIAGLKMSYLDPFAGSTLDLFAMRESHLAFVYRHLNLVSRLKCMILCYIATIDNEMRWGK